MIEPYLKATELAHVMGVSLRVVEQWTAEGMPSETWGMRVRRYRASEAMAWVRGRSQVESGEHAPLGAATPRAGLKTQQEVINDG